MGNTYECEVRQLRTKLSLSTSRWKKKFAACQSLVHALRELCVHECISVKHCAVCVCLCKRLVCPLFLTIAA